jgi:MFS family permease
MLIFACNFMNFQPSQLNDATIASGLKMVVKDGLAAEAMSTLTGGAFLVAMALQLGATNFQVGLLAAMPTLTNVFQLLAIWLVQHYNNRKIVTVLCSLIARVPLLLIGVMPFLFSRGSSLMALLFLLSFHYFFGSIAGASWNSWMKDLVPERILGSYYSYRTRLIQVLNVTLSLSLALVMDYVKVHFPAYTFASYCVMFLLGGAAGSLGVYLLMRTPEPKADLVKENVFKAFGQPFRDFNFRKLLFFNAGWTFSLNLATPFFSVFMMKTLGLPLSYIVGFNVLAQLSSIFSLKMWGRFADKYSNKNIFKICAPIYIACILAWAFTTIPATRSWTILLLALINTLSGFALAGINLAIGNICIKLAPRGQAMSYLSASNMLMAAAAALAPILGGIMADFISRHGISFGNMHFLQQWNLLFVIAAFSAIGAVQLLRNIREDGEVEHKVAAADISGHMYTVLKERTSRRSLQRLIYLPTTLPALRRKRRIAYRGKGLEKWMK